MGVVIRGGTIVNAGERFEADVKVEGRTINLPNVPEPRVRAA